MILCYNLVNYKDLLSYISYIIIVLLKVCGEQASVPGPFQEK